MNSKYKKPKWKLLHQYFSYTGFYTFVWDAIKKAFPYIVIAIIGIIILNKYFNINAFLEHLTQTLPIYGVLLFFFASETILGLLPPEIFIAWAGKLHAPWLYLFILALLSYCGGLLAYYIGKLITKVPVIHNYLEVKMEKQLKNSKKWGGFLIIVGALLPLPFSISCMAAGIIGYNFNGVMLFGTLRFLRFLIYALVIFHIF